MGQIADPEELLQRWLQGDQEAGAQLLASYTQRLIQLVYRRLPENLRSKVDPEDIVQSAVRTLLRRKEERLIELHSTAQLWSLLAIIVLRKCSAQCDRFFARIRDVRREVSASLPDEDSRTWAELCARGPTPQQVAVANELLDTLRESLEPRCWEIVQLKLLGYTTKEIAEKLNCSVRAVQLGVRLAEKRLAEAADSQNTPSS